MSLSTMRRVTVFGAQVVERLAHTLSDAVYTVCDLPCKGDAVLQSKVIAANNK